MKIKPKISVIMSAYNVEKYIAESIESILNQTFRDFELIIINDASTDKTLDIIKGFMKKDKRLKLINNKKNLYATISRNKALRIAKGVYIAIQDGDDISLPVRLSLQNKYLDKHKDIFLVGSGIIKISADGSYLDKRMPICSKILIKLMLPIRNQIYHPSVMFRNKGCLYRNKIYYAEDYDLYLVLISNGLKLANLREYLVKYRILNSSVSNSKRKQQDLFAEKAKEFYKQRKKIGKDKYNQFNPQEISKIN